MAINKNKINDNALKFLQKGQIKKAIREYDKILEEDPADVRTLLKKGDLQVRIGEKDEAVDSYLRVANAYSQQGFHLKAVAVFKQILKIDEQRIDVNLRLADEYQNLGIVGDAMAHLQVVATHYEQQGLLRESLDIFRRLVELDPENIASRIKLAELYSREDEIPKAVAEFSHAAKDLKNANRIEDYIKVSERLIFHDSTNVSLIKELANIYLQRGDTKRALGKLQICFKSDPHDLETLSMLALAFQELNQLSKTVSVYKEMARIYQEQSEFGEMQAIYRRILEIAPDDVDATHALAGRATGAEPGEYEVDVEKDTDYPPVAHAEIPTHELPIADLQQAAKPVVSPRPAATVQPNGREMVSRLLTETEVYVKYGLQDKAQAHLKNVLKIDPNHVEARKKLKDLYLSLGQNESAAQELLFLAQQSLERSSPDEAKAYLRSLLGIVPSHAEGIALARQLKLSLPAAIDKPKASEPEIRAEPGHDEAEEISISDEVPIEIDEGEPVPEEEGYEGETVLAERESVAPSEVEGENLTPEVNLDEVEEVEPVEEAMLNLDGEEAALGGVSKETGEYAREEIENYLDIENEAEIEDVSEFAGDPEMNDLADEAVSPAEESNEPSVVSIDDDELELIDFGEDDEFFQDKNGAPADEQEVEKDKALPPEDLDDLGLPPDGANDMGDLDVPTLVGKSTSTSTPSRANVIPIDENPAVEEEVRQVQFEESTQIHSGESLDVKVEEPGDLSEALEEIDFYMQQNLLDEANDEIERLIGEHPDHPEIKTRAEKLQRLRLGEASIHKLAPERIEEPFDLAAEIEKEADSSALLPLNEDFQYSVDDVFSEFKKGVEKVVAREDSSTHFDLGIAYKEMGLLDDAVNEFSIAAQDATKRIVALTMIGLCFMEKEQFSEAINRFKEALHGTGITEQEAMGVYYELGQAYESLHDSEEALFYFKKVHKRDPNFRDVNKKIPILSKTKDAMEKPEEKNLEQKKTDGIKSKISYM